MYHLLCVKFCGLLYKQMSTPSGGPASVIVSGGDKVAVQSLKGGAVLSPLPLSGGARRKRLSKKTLRMLKGMSKAKLMRLAGKKGGAKKGTRKTKRRSGLLY